jgi:hypothetical protein
LSYVHRFSELFVHSGKENVQTKFIDNYCAFEKLFCVAAQEDLLTKLSMNDLQLNMSTASGVTCGETCGTYAMLLLHGMQGPADALFVVGVARAKQMP